ncbi:SDR family NAD(P)-dependent oxidoreductase [Paramicrobacterium chengjingii]|uniref:SDR family NAD(P)-dependent oxidoreductase n=1 Tax=Paramicrobacterium chengjingii TaxID=2769067 RepID=UPI001422B044|nr:SDR family NAD(P)-dependent oxidoreductase [Microbacterium chengjingii]
MHDAQKGRPQTTIIVGAGPGIGLAVARRFARGGGSVGLVARSKTRLAELAEILRGDGVDAAWQTADATDPEMLRAALNRLAEQLGPIDVLCFCPLPDIDLIRPVMKTSARHLGASAALSVGGAATAVQTLVPAMIERGRGSVLFTTGSGAINPTPERAASVVSTAAETAYVSILHHALAQQNVRVGQLVIVGAVGPGQKHEPDAVADALWAMHTADGGVMTVLDRPVAADARATHDC